MTLRQKIVRRWTRIKTRVAYTWETVTRCWCGSDTHRSHDPRVACCMDCGTGVLRRRLTEASYERWYSSGDYRRYTMGTDGVSVGQFLKEMRRGEAAFKFMSDHGFDIYGKSVMDVGSGAGGALIVGRLLRASYLLGVDSDPRSEKVPAAFGIQIISDCPAADNWDRVICSHLIEHVIRPVEFLRMLAMYHSPEGCIYVETPAWGPKAEVKLPHPFYYSPASFRFLAERAGLKVEAMDDGIRAVLKRAG